MAKTDDIGRHRGGERRRRWRCGGWGSLDGWSQVQRRSRDKAGSEEGKKKGEGGAVKTGRRKDRCSEDGKKKGERCAVKRGRRNERCN